MLNVMTFLAPGPGLLLLDTSIAWSNDPLSKSLLVLVTTRLTGPTATVVVNDVKLLLGSRSPSEAVAEANTFCTPLKTIKSNVKSTNPPDGTDAAPHWSSSPVKAQLVPMKSKPSVAVGNIRTFVAIEGPLFLTRPVYWIWSPALAVAGPMIDTDRSAFVLDAQVLRNTNTP